jgi:hypothetical protein
MFFLDLILNDHQYLKKHRILVCTHLEEINFNFTCIQLNI